MFILQNKKAQKEFLDTKPVAMTYDFLKALFRMEINFKRKEETFTMNKESRPRQLNHLTHADLAVATVLFVVCNTQGQIWNVTPHMIYQKLADLYENPISSSQFYESLEKFKLHGLIKEEETKGLYNYQLNYFWDHEKGRILRYVIFHPVIFTEAFSKLPLSHKKLFYVAVGQQRKKAYTQYHSLKNDGEDFSGMYALTHKNQRHQVRQILTDLTELPIMDGQALFSIGKLERKGKGSYVGIYSVNAYFIMKSVKGQKYHEPILARKVYPRLYSWVKNWLWEHKAGEILEYNQGQYAFQLIRGMSKLSRSVMKHVLEQLILYFQTYRSLPADLARFIREKRITKTEALILQTAEETGVRSLISLHAPKKEKKYREQEFASKLSAFPLKAIKEACQSAFKALQATVIERTLPLEQYVIEEALSPWKEFSLVRLQAHREQRDPIAYESIERWAYSQMELGYHSNEAILQFALEQVDKLPYASIIPDVQNDFKLENLLVEKHLSCQK
ncbi:hypothetical protein [Ammoniphilus sp. 3BR4]|uniref:hypothetical protein n=1 Tax=Ammoniphilus sp. 3BR4 TaxID=3158265 RepID=UPI003466F007